MHPKISIIIPTGNPERAVRAVKALSTQTIPSEMYEIIIVVPNAYRSQLENINNLRIVTTEQLYPAGRMRNAGARAASGNILFFLDDDCIPPENWLEVMMSEIDKQRDVAMLGCRIVSESKTFWARCADYALYAPCQYRTRRSCGFGSAALAMRRDCFQEAAGFDENLMSSQDWDFFMRVKKSGRKCMFIPEIEVLHSHRRASFRDIMRSAFLSGYRSGLYVQRKYLAEMSIIARLAVFLGNKRLYPWLMVPYSMVVSLSYVVQFVRWEPSVLVYLPFMLLAGMAYHFGVWRRLVYDNLFPASST